MMSPQGSMLSPQNRSNAAGTIQLLLLLVGLGWQLSSCASATPAQVPPPAVDNPKSNGPTQVAVLSGGCFWGVQGVYEHVRGVEKVLAGYAGGDKSTAHYDMVSSGSTGHAESVEITFNPAEVSYGEILRIFFSVVHDPTQLDRQGPDVGSQYRSAIDYTDETQKEIALAYIRQLDRSGVFRHPIVTRVDPLRGFFAAENYHQDFLLHYPTNPYIALNDLPKVAALKQLFPASYSDHPVTVAVTGP